MYIEADYIAKNQEFEDFRYSEFKKIELKWKKGSAAIVLE